MSTLGLSSKSLTSNRATIVSDILAHPVDSGLMSRLSAALIRWSDRLIDGMDHQRTVKVLQSMDDRLLSDIGLSRADVDGFADASGVKHR